MVKGGRASRTHKGGWIAAEVRSHDSEILISRLHEALSKTPENLIFDK